MSAKVPQKGSRVSPRSIEIAKDAVKRLEEKYGSRLISVVLYGSFARGEERQTSDLDLFIVLKGPFRFVAMRREIYDLLSHIKTDFEFSPLVMEHTQFQKLQPIHFELYADGIILYDRNNFMDKIMNRVGEIIKNLSSTRYKTKGGCYGWILKKDIKKGEVIEVEL